MAIDPQAPPEPKAAGEESYLASLSDLMVGLLFIFIIILMAFALNYRQAEMVSEQTAEEQRQQTAQLLAQTVQQQAEQQRLQTETEKLKLEQFRLIQETDAQIEQQTRLQQEKTRLEHIVQRLTDNNRIRRHLLQALQDDLALRGVPVFIDEKNGILRLPESLLFDSGEAQFNTEGHKALGQLAAVLASILPCYSLAPPPLPRDCPLQTEVQARLEAVFIEGHTDDRPIRTADFPNNWALATARALNTYRTLIAEAPVLEQLRNSQHYALLSVSAYEARRPVAPNQDEAARRNNRRIDLRFIMSSPPPPLIEEAQRRLQD